MDDMVQAIGYSLVGETIQQATGRSNKKWALVLLAFVVGAGLATWVMRRKHKPQAPSADITTS